MSLKKRLEKAGLSIAANGQVTAASGKVYGHVYDMHGKMLGGGYMLDVKTELMMKYGSVFFHGSNRDAMLLRHLLAARPGTHGSVTARMDEDAIPPKIKKALDKNVGFPEYDIDRRGSFLTVNIGTPIILSAEQLVGLKSAGLTGITYDRKLTLIFKG